MPKTLRRAGRYGWSRAYSWNSETKRFNTDQYLENFDKIAWSTNGYDDSWVVSRKPGSGYNKGAIVMVKKF